MKVQQLDLGVEGLPFGKPLRIVLAGEFMSQTEIKEYLENHGPATVKELASALDLNHKSVRASLRSLEKWNEVVRTNTHVAYKADVWGLPKQINSLEKEDIQGVAANAD